MSKRPRTAVSDESSSDGGGSGEETVRARNKRLRRVGSVESDDQSPDEPLDERNNDSMDVGNMSDERLSFPVTLRVNRRPPSDDEYTESASENEDESEPAEEFSDGGFVVDSDDNFVSTRASRRQRSLRRRKARRLRTRRGGRSTSEEKSDDGSDGVSDTSIAEELRELNGSSRRPKARHFRARAPVDYSIPPPPTVEEVARAEPKRDKQLRRLYDIRGPFGGADALALFPLKREELVALSERKVNTVPPVTGDVESAEVTDVDFSVVGGLDDYIAKLKEMISLPLLYPELYEKLGITPPRGVLFHGPPGTGKTLMARALAASHKQEKVAFYMRKGADVLSKWIGESERQLRALFDEARANQPSIIFFDEIDGLAPVRSARQEQHHASIVSTLLALMDGMDNRGQVVVIGATNRPDSVDPALRRPGRFDREFYFPLPNTDARKRILEIHTRKWSPPPDPALINDLAAQTKGFGGADLRALTTEAALLAIQHTYPQIYAAREKLAVDPSAVSVRAQDFALALERIQPSSARPAAPAAAPLPPRIKPLLRRAHDAALQRVRTALPSLHAPADARAAVYLDGQQFAHTRAVALFNAGRVHRPRLLLRGVQGAGHAAVARAVAAALEGVYVVELGAAVLASAPSTPEAAIVAAFAEARRRAPACLLLPDLAEWTGAPLASLLAGLLRSLAPTEQVLVLGAADSDNSPNDLVEYFETETLEVVLDTSDDVLREFFTPVLEFVRRTPRECLVASEVPKKPPPHIAPASVNPPIRAISDESLKPSLDPGRPVVFSEQDRSELRTRSQLKLKLGVILDGFRARFRRFRKPVIDEPNLAFLFEPKVPEREEQYQRTADDMILDTQTGKKFYNMDLETVEDRLWNGYYCEVVQFLEDVEKIYRDALETGDRERIHKAAEMLANAQVAVDDISADKEFTRSCRALRVKDAQVRLREMDEKAQADDLEEPGRDHSCATTVAEQNNDHDDIVTDDPESHSMVVDISTTNTVHAHQPDFVPEPEPTDNTQESPLVSNECSAGAHATSSSTASSASMPKSPPLASSDVSMPIVAHSPSSAASRPLCEHITVPLVPPESYDVPVDDLKQHSQSTDAGLSEPEGRLILDESEFAALEADVVARAKDFTLEQLEHFSAQLANTAWQFRMDWDRTPMLRALRSLIRG